MILQGDGCKLLNETDCKLSYVDLERIVSLPIYPGMTEADVRDVIVAVRKLVQE
jgi:dTDP-4-amino-4,6-dideoxygalactose transaminase